MPERRRGVKPRVESSNTHPSPTEHPPTTGQPDVLVSDSDDHEDANATSSATQEEQSPAALINEAIRHHHKQGFIPCPWCDHRVMSAKRKSELLDHMRTCQRIPSAVRFAVTRQYYLELFNIDLKQCSTCQRACIRLEAHQKRCVPGQHQAGPGHQVSPMTRPPTAQDMSVPVSVSNESDLDGCMMTLRQLCVPLTASARIRHTRDIKHLVLRLLQDLTALAYGEYTELDQEYRTQQRLVQLENMSVTFLQVLPGLQALLQRGGSRGKDLMNRMYDAPRHEATKKWGLARVLYHHVVVVAFKLDVLVAPNIPGDHDRPTKSSAPQQRTLRFLAREGYLSKAMSLARRASQLSVPTNRPTLSEVKSVVRDKFPQVGAPSDMEAMRRSMPSMDTSGCVNWAREDERREAQMEKYGRQPVQLVKEDLTSAIYSLGWQSASGPNPVSNRMLRYIFEDDEESVEGVLLPFANALLAGRFHESSMKLLLQSRLCLLPKPAKPDGTTDYRPLGIGCALLRLLNKAVAKSQTQVALKVLAPLQTAVGVKDAGVLVAAIIQAAYDKGLDILNTDIKNAYNSISRDLILSSLQQHMPQLVRWFLVCYSQPQDLFVSSGAAVGQCHTGVMQGDPLSTIYFCLGFHAALTGVAQQNRTAHPSTIDNSALVSCRAFADDSWLTGNGEKLLEGFTGLQLTFQDDAGLEVNASKSKLLVSGDCSDERWHELQAKADECGVELCGEGFVVMGIPVGSRSYRAEWLEARVEMVLDDLDVLHPFTRQQAFALLTYCVNARLMYLQRALNPQELVEHLRTYDKRATCKLLEIAGVVDEAKRDEYFRHVHFLRGLPMSLSGVMRRLSSSADLMFAYRNANDRLARTLKRTMPAEYRAVCETRFNKHARVVQLRPSESYVEPCPVPTDIHEYRLQGHVLGNIDRDTYAREVEEPINPDLDVERDAAIQHLRHNQADRHLLTHTVLMNILRSQNKNQFAAHVLSSSSVGTGGVWRWFPIPGSTIKCDNFQQLLRCRLAIPTSETIPTATCKCTAGRRESPEDLEEGVSDGLIALDPIELTDQPLHGLLCRKQGCAGRVKRRHDAILNELYNRLRGIGGIVVDKTPRVNPTSEHQADLSVCSGAHKWFVDIQVTCPATSFQVLRGAHFNHSVAAERSSHRKKQKYAKLLGQEYRKGIRVPGFVPFVVETGGRILAESRAWLDALLKEHDDTRRKTYRNIHRIMVHRQASMLAMYLNSVK